MMYCSTKMIIAKKLPKVIIVFQKEGWGGDVWGGWIIITYSMVVYMAALREGCKINNNSKCKLVLNWC